MALIRGGPVLGNGVTGNWFDDSSHYNFESSFIMAHIGQNMLQTDYRQLRGSP
jgi:hypothetical protein